MNNETCQVRFPGYCEHFDRIGASALQMLISKARSASILDQVSKLLEVCLTTRYAVLFTSLLHSGPVIYHPSQAFGNIAFTKRLRAIL
jgi:hypothetical protein